MWLLRLGPAAQSLEPFYEKFDPEFTNIRKIVREVLQKEDDLNEIVQLVGKARPLPPRLTRLRIPNPKFPTISPVYKP